MFRMKVEGWQEIIGFPVPSHEGVVSYSPIGIHQCTVSINKESIQRPINSAAIQLAKIIKEFCGYCTISGSAVLAEYLHDLPGCEHCYEKHYNTFLRDVCGRGGFNNDIDIFVPDFANNLTRFYETGDRERLGTMYRGFDESTLESHIFPALYKQYGIRHTSVSVQTSVSVGLDKKTQSVLMILLITMMRVQTKQLWTMDVSKEALFVLCII